jgi:diadenosine tetraphosphatase ApaH/serine/threonine PP2A family protein phosphatase
MRYAVLSDIHSNREALEAVLAACETERVDAYVCLGDLVGYGPDPGEVIAKVRAREMLTVRGNHDHAAFDPGEDRYFNDWARDAIAWTRERLSADERSYLTELELEARVDGALLVHASPSLPRAWRYVLSAAEAAVEFASFEEAACFIGHSHVPMAVAERGTGVVEIPAEEIEMASGERYIINVGSVGQPRDGDPRAAFGLYDSDRRTYRLARVEYDSEATSQKIFDAGLPSMLGERLLSGR